MNVYTFNLFQIVERDTKNKKIKVHYVGYPTSMDEWKGVQKEEERMCAMREAFKPSESSFDDRLNLLSYELYTKIKQSLFSSKKYDPLVKFEINTHPDMQDHLSTLIPKIENDHKIIYRVQDNGSLESFLGND